MSKPFNNKQIGMYLEYESSYKWNGRRKWMHKEPPPIAVAEPANQFVLYFLNCKNLKSLKAQYIYLYWKKEFPLFKKIDRTKTSFCIAFNVFARILLLLLLLLLAKTLLFNILQMTGSCTPSKHNVLHKILSRNKNADTFSCSFNKHSTMSFYFEWFNHLRKIILPNTVYRMST